MGFQSRSEARAFECAPPPTLNVSRLIQDIRDQAKVLGGFMSIPLLDPGDEPYTGPGPSFIEVARHPFILWALGPFDYTAFNLQRPEWRVLSPSGIRIAGDSPIHSEWVLSAGLIEGEEYGMLDSRRDPRHRGIARGIDHARVKISEEWSGSRLVVMSLGHNDLISGPIVIASPHEEVPAGSVAVANTAGPEFQLAMTSANRPGPRGRGALICMSGGPVAHLAKVGREYNCNVFLLPDALKRYRPGQEVAIDVLNRSMWRTI